MRKFQSSIILFFGILICAIVVSVLSFSLANAPLSYDASLISSDEKEEIFIPTHIKTPNSVKAVYMTSWVAGTKLRRDALVSLIKETELNSVVIDIKDYSGNISVLLDHPIINNANSVDVRISDAIDFIESLHKNGIYVIGRVTVFQDPHYAKLRNELAVKRESDGTLWADYKNISYLDPGSKEVWDYHVAIAKESYKIGFDEINFDYIRFPSDGNMNDIYYPFSDKTIVANPENGKADILEEFFTYLSKELSGIGVVISADLFGMTTTNPDDLNIGQVLERAEPHFDFIAPMVYPSHYPNNFLGFENPAENPYEIVRYSLDKGVARLLAASSTPTKLRPWLQDFDLGADYTKELVRSQIDATYDAGLTSWMLWSPSNYYTRGALYPMIE